jgi:hypothetical protein
VEFPGRSSGARFGAAIAAPSRVVGAPLTADPYADPSPGAIAPAGAALPRAGLLKAARIERIVALSAVLAIVTDRVWITDLMRSFGVTGAVVNLVTFSPLLLLAARHWRQLLQRESASLVAVTLYAVSTAAWSSHHIDSAARSESLIIMLAFLACFRASPVFVRTVASAATVGAVFVPAYVIGSGGSWVDSRSGLPLLALAASLYVQRRVTWRAIPLVAAAVLTTIRANIIAALAGILVTLLRSRRGTFAVLAVVIAGSVAVNVVDPGGGYRPHKVEREDIVGRFQTIEDDRASNRIDLWSAVIQDASRRDPFSREMLIGWGIGDVCYHVGRVFPLEAVVTRDNEGMASAHNTILELCLTGGLLMVPLVLWMLVDLVRYARADDRTMSILLVVLPIALAGEILMSMGGNSALAALLFATLRRPDPAPSTAPGRQRR